MADKRKLLELDIDVESIIAKSVQLKTTLDSLRASQDVLKKSGDTNSDTYVKLAAQISKTSSEYGLNQKQLSNLAQVSGNYLNINQKVGLSLDKEVKSISEARANNTELLKIRNELNLSKIEEAKLAAEINAKLDVNNKFIKENVSQYEQQKIGIGDYKTAIVGALQESGLFGGQLQNITQYSSNFTGIYSKMKSELSSSISQIKNAGAETEGLGKAQAAGAIATNVSTGALRLFKLALAATGIGLVVLALGSLIGYFTQTQAGIDKLNSVLVPLKTIFLAITGVVSELGGKLVDTFSNPKKALEDLGNFVKQNLINRFTAFGKILDGILHFDFKKVADGALQAGTGVENLTGKIANGAKATAKFLEDNAKKGAEIARIQREVNDKQLEYNKNQVSVNDKLDEQLLISKDTSRSFSERAVAAREIISISEENGKKEEAILQLKLKQLQIEQSLKGAKNLTNEDKQKTIDLLSQIDEAEDRGLNARLEQSKVISGFKKEQQANDDTAAQKRRDEASKLIDAGIAKSKTELDLFIAQQGTRAKSLEEGLKLEEEIRDKKLSIAKKEFDSKKITQTEFELQSLNIKNEFLKKQADATVANAQMELTDFIDNNKSKLDNNQFLTDELVAQELDRINRVSEAKAKEATTRLEEGKINEKEYAAAIKVIDDKVVEDNKAVTEAKVAADVEKTAIDLDNKIAATANEFEAKQLELDNNLAQELAAAEKSGASKKLIEDKYALAQKQLDKSVQDAKLSGIYNALGMAAGLFKEHTAAYKALAIAQTMIQTYQSATLAYSSAFLPIPTIASPALGAVFAGVAVASGLANIAKIAGVKMARGAILQGDSHANGGIPFTVDGKPGFEAEGGEAIINKKSTAQYGHLLSAINQAGGGVAFAGGGITYPTSVLNTFNQSNQGSQIDYDLLASKIGSNVAQANLSLPKPIVYTAITDINNGQNDYAQVVNGANF